MPLDMPQTGSDAQQPRQDNQFRFVLNVLANHWIAIAAGTLLGALLVGGWSMLRVDAGPARYAAAAELIMRPSKYERDILQGLGGAPPFSLQPRELVQQISHRVLAEEVVRALVQRDLIHGGPYAAAASEEDVEQRTGELLGRIQVTPVENAPKLRVDVINCATQEEAEEIAEFTTRVFIELARQLRLEEEQDTHAFYKQKLEELRQQLFSAETDEWDFKKRMGFRTFNKINEDMASMYAELSELKVTREETQAKLQELDAELTMAAAELPDALSQPTDEVVSRLFAELDDLLRQQLEMSAVYMPEYPGMRELADEIAQQQQVILDTIAQLEGGAPGGSNVWRQRQQVYRQQVEMRMRLGSLDIRAASLQRMLEELIPQIPELANQNLEHERLVNEVTRLREQFNQVRQHEFNIRTAISNERGQLERTDRVAALGSLTPPVYANVWMNFLIGGLVGFVASFSIAMMREANDTSIRTIEDVTESIGLEVIGTIPRMRFGTPRGNLRKRAMYVTTVDEAQIDACIVTQHDPRSPISEAYRTLRTNFQFATIQRRPRSIMVTSAVPGEGKTTTAVNMAVTMADQGSRVLIVDTDLRRPNVHRVLRMERGPGLSDVLREGARAADVIRPTRIPNLSIVSSGRVPPNPSELLGSERMGVVMRELSAQFDIIICDAPSVLVVTDPVLLATRVDSTVLVVSANFARKETVMRANKLLESAQSTIAGVVLNGLEATRRHYYYYYYYYDDGSKVERKWYHFA